MRYLPRCAVNTDRGKVIQLMRSICRISDGGGCAISLVAVSDLRPEDTLVRRG